MARKILIVEDDASTRLVIRAILERQYALLFAKNGLEGITLLNQNPDICMIICDVFMPILDGFGFTEHVRKAEGSKIPIVLMSTQAAKEIIHKARTLKASGWINKPLQKPEVLQIVNNLAPP